MSSPQKMTRVQLVESPGGQALSDGGSLLSCRTDGTITTVPLGTTGPAVLVAINGNIATYDNGDVYNFPFVKTLPNHVGWSGIYLIAL